MKRLSMSVCLVTFLLLSAIAPGSKQAKADQNAENSCCDLVAQALKDYASIKEGSKRSDLERYFSQSGGLSSVNEEVYVYKKCRYIRLTVTFASGTNAPADVISALSKLPIDYEATD
jgi:hypothetical protein